MANNIEGSAVGGVNKSISGGNGNQLADMTKNLFFGRIFGKRGTNEGPSAGNGGGGKPMSKKQIARYDAHLDNHARRQMEYDQHSFTLNEGAANTEFTRRQAAANNNLKRTSSLIRTAAGSGSPSNLTVNHDTGDHSISFHQTGQQQQRRRANNVKK